MMGRLIMIIIGMTGLTKMMSRLIRMAMVQMCKELLLQHLAMGLHLGQNGLVGKYLIMLDTQRQPGHLVVGK